MDESKEKRPFNGRPRGRGRGVRAPNQVIPGNVGAPSQSGQVQLNQTREPSTSTCQTSARDIQLQNQFQQAVRWENSHRNIFLSRRQANQDRLTTQFHREQAEESACARHRSPSGFQTNQLQSSQPITEHGVAMGASSTRDEMEERKQIQDQAEREKYTGRGTQFNFQPILGQVSTNKPAQATDTNKGTTEARQDFPATARAISPRELQLQNQFRQECSEYERRMALVEARGAAQQERLNAQFQREIEEQRNATRSHTQQTGTLPKTLLTPARVTTTNATPASCQLTARDIQLQNQFHQERREDERQRALVEARGAAQQERLNAQFQREKAEEQRNVARSHTEATPTRVMATSTTPALHHLIGWELQNEVHRELTEEVERVYTGACRVLDVLTNPQFRNKKTEEIFEEQRNAIGFHNQQQAIARNQQMRGNVQLREGESGETESSHHNRPTQEANQCTASGGLPAARRNEAPACSHTSFTPLSDPIAIIPMNEHMQYQHPFATVLQPVVYTRAPCAVWPTVVLIPHHQQQHQEGPVNNGGWGESTVHEAAGARAPVDQGTTEKIDSDDSWEEETFDDGDLEVPNLPRMPQTQQTARVEMPAGESDDSSGSERSQYIYGTPIRGTSNSRVTEGWDSPDEDDRHSWSQLSARETARARAAVSQENNDSWTLPSYRGWRTPASPSMSPTQAQQRTGDSANTESNWSLEERKSWSYPPSPAAAARQQETATSTSGPVEHGSLGMCLVCLHQPRTTMFLDCGHIACCQTCSYSLATCPTCRAYIRKVQRAYLP